MIASPILNPVSIFATVYAFGVRIPEMILYRTVIGAFIAFIVGILISFVAKPNEVLNQIDSEDDSSCCSHGSCCNTLQNSKGIKSKIVNIFNHARIEFFRHNEIFNCWSFNCSTFTSVNIKDCTS